VYGLRVCGLAADGNPGTKEQNNDDIAHGRGGYPLPGAEVWCVWSQGLWFGCRWESGYWKTMDIAHDRAGYYLCWGCLNWVPAVYTSQTLFLASHPYQLSTPAALAIFAAGTACIYVNYDADRQRQVGLRTFFTQVCRPISLNVLAVIGPKSCAWGRGAFRRQQKGLEWSKH
jgi:hypothetical protein